MDCPRCGAPLREHEPTRKWFRFFECRECWLAFEEVLEKRWTPCALDARRKFIIRHTMTLQQGRTAQPAGWMLEEANEKRKKQK